MLTNVSISKFKQISEAALALAPINVLVGGNNSGKSCILQAIHFGIALSQSRAIAGAAQFPAERLRYCPTEDFLDLRNGTRLTEGASIQFNYQGSAENGAVKNANVRLERGRNGVVKAEVSGNQLLTDISDPKGFYSIYVPGLAGITIREEYRSELVVNNGIARGDANLYLRNVLLRITQNPARHEKFLSYLQMVFPQIEVRAQFNETSDLWIRATAKMPSGVIRPLDMVGTGLLQAVQLLAYVCNYEPKVLLLDEPDAHLHPSNQRVLADTLSVIAKNTETRIVLATHSRHLLDSLSENPQARLFWVKNGEVASQENWSDIAILLDLGALDKGERLLAGAYRFLLWTEDRDTSFLEKLIEANNIPLGDVLIFSYQASSKIDAAKLMAAFVERVRPGVRTIIHRDRDFMSDAEVQRLIAKYQFGDGNVRLFITEQSDIEAMFCSAAHIAGIANKSEAEIQQITNEILAQNMVEFVLAFREKREEIRKTLYRNDPDNFPPIGGLIAGGNVTIDQAVGKLLLKKILVRLQDGGINGGAIKAASPSLISASFQRAFAEP